MKKVELDDRRLAILLIKVKLDGYKTLFEKSNEIIIWLVGFSITGSGLLAFKESTESTEEGRFILYAKLLFLVTIICGISYRFLFSWLSMSNKKLDGFINYLEQNIPPSGERQESIINFLDQNDLIAIQKHLKEEGITTDTELMTNTFLKYPPFKLNTFEKLSIEVMVRSYLYTVITALPEETLHSLDNKLFAKYNGDVEQKRSMVYGLYSDKLRRDGRKLILIIKLTGIAGAVSVIAFVIILLLPLIK